MEPTSFTEMLKQFGPYGVSLFLMGSGLVYLMRWLREERKQSDATHEGIRNTFLGQLKDQRIEYTDSLKQVTADFKGAMTEQGKRIDNIAVKVDQIDEHIQELRMVR